VKQYARSRWEDDVAGLDKEAEKGLNVAANGVLLHLQRVAARALVSRAEPHVALSPRCPRHVLPRRRTNKTSVQSNAWHTSRREAYSS
jgi:hypothetical protein